MRSLVDSAVSNIPGVDFASISVRHRDHSVETLVATDDLAVEVDALQYRMQEGPYYEAVTDERFVLDNDLAHPCERFARYGPQAAELGVRSQAAIQLLHDSEQAGLNLYSRKPNSFDRSTIDLAELFAGQAAALLGYARQVESLSEALHARQDIGTAVGIVMERYQINPERAFAYLVRHSNDRNLKLRTIAQQIVDGSFPRETSDDDDE